MTGPPASPNLKYSTAAPAGVASPIKLTRVSGPSTSSTVSPIRPRQRNSTTTSIFSAGASLLARHSGCKPSRKPQCDTHAGSGQQGRALLSNGFAHGRPDRKRLGSYAASLQSIGAVVRQNVAAGRNRTPSLADTAADDRSTRANASLARGRLRTV